MEADDFGIEQITEEDRRYRGSRFSEVRAAIFANPYQNLWGNEGILPLPRYETTVSSVFRGLLGRHYLFREASERAVDSHADLR